MVSHIKHETVKLKGEGKILVTGGLGYLGLSLVEHLATLTKQSVIAFDVLDPSSMLDERDRNKLTDKGVQFYQGDVRDLSLLIDLLRKENIRGVIHTASFSDVSIFPFPLQ